MPYPETGDAPENEEQMYDTAEGMLNGVRNDHDLDMQDPSQRQSGGSGRVDGAAQQQPSSTEHRKPNQVRITTPYLTKYERARVLGTRALQIR
jgi:hypothetical protein